MFTINRRYTLRLLAALGLTRSTAAVTSAQAQVKEIRIDFATYNPVSLVLKDKGLLEKEFAKDGITVRWVQSPAPTRRSNSSMPARSISARRPAPRR